MKRIQAFLLLPETQEQPQASEPQAVIVSGSSILSFGKLLHAEQQSQIMCKLQPLQTAHVPGGL